jgi:hypothetical protein
MHIIIYRNDEKVFYFKCINGGKTVINVKLFCIITSSHFVAEIKVHHTFFICARINNLNHNTFKSIKYNMVYIILICIAEALRKRTK